MSANPHVTQLIRHSLEGDQQSFAALFEQYKNLVFKTAYLLLDNSSGGREPGPEAEEALQEVFLRVHRHLGSYQPDKAAFSTWLYRITVNYCLSRRRRRSFPWLSLDCLPGSHAAALSFEQDLAEVDAVRHALSHLSDKLRAAVVLRFYAELSYADIAQALNIPIGTVKSRLDLALKQLGRELGPSFGPASQSKCLVTEVQ